MAKYSNPVGQWLVLVVAILCIGLVIGYQYGQETVPDVGKQPTLKTQQLPNDFILRPISANVYSYLVNAYAAHDKNQIVLVATWDDWCLGVPCEYWALKTHVSQLTILLRCYPTLGNQCVPTYESEPVMIADGNKPPVTPVMGE